MLRLILAATTISFRLRVSIGWRLRTKGGVPSASRALSIVQSWHGGLLLPRYGYSAEPSVCRKGHFINKPFLATGHGCKSPLTFTSCIAQFFSIYTFHIDGARFRGKREHGKKSVTVPATVIGKFVFQIPLDFSGKVKNKRRTISQETCHLVALSVCRDNGSERNIRTGNTCCFVRSVIKNSSQFIV